MIAGSSRNSRFDCIKCGTKLGLSREDAQSNIGINEGVSGGGGVIF